MSSLADKLKNKTADETKTEAAIEAKEAHILALEQGLRVFRKERLNKVILKDGTQVKPTPEGFFIALTPEIEAHLVHHATNQHGQVEEVLQEAPEEDTK